MLEIVNIVASGHLERELDLKELQKDLDVNEKIYEPERFPGLQLRFDEGSTVIILYSTGSYSIMGAKSEEEIEDKYMSLRGAIENLGFDIPNTAKPPGVRNLICKANLEQEVKLSALSVGLGLENTEYEPEQSPFLFYWPENQDCLITIPSNGTISITGVETIEEAEHAFAHIQTRIEKLFQQ